MRLRWLREIVRRGFVALRYVQTRDNVADIFTKLLSPSDHDRLRIALMSGPSGHVPTRHPYRKTTCQVTNHMPWGGTRIHTEITRAPHTCHQTRYPATSPLDDTPIWHACSFYGTCFRHERSLNIQQQNGPSTPLLQHHFPQTRTRKRPDESDGSLRDGPS